MTGAAFGVLLAGLITAACSGSGVERGLTENAPVGTADALVALPPAPVLTAPPSASSGGADRLALGEWSWSAPCRVDAREVVGTRVPRVVRTFTVDIAADDVDDGLVLSFDDVAEVSDNLTDAQIATALYRNLAVLPAMRLDADGRFVAFDELEADLAALARRAEVASADEVALGLARQQVVTDTILDRTVLGWYGFWIEHAGLPVNPDRLVAERLRAGPAGPWRWSTETFAAPVRGDRGGPDRDGVVWLTHTERAIDSETGRIDASAIVDPTDRRPSYVVLSVSGFSSGGLAAFNAQDRRIVTFDWENAEGCA